MKQDGDSNIAVQTEMLMLLVCRMYILSAKGLNG